MKDQIDPLGSESAAYLNQLEVSRFDDLGDVAQKMLSLFSSHSAVLGSVVLPPIPEQAKAILSTLVRKLTDRVVLSEKINLEDFAYLVVSDLQRHAEVSTN